jgi:hypothetical protein
MGPGRSFVMDDPAVILCRAAIVAATTEFKLELAEMLGLDVMHATVTQQHPGSGSKLADLDEASARVFLSGCGAKTTKVLRLIVQQKGSFYLGELERAARASTSGLRGVWTGITKRTRTITGDPDAALIGWKQRGDDHEGWLSPATYASLKVIFRI